ncbi:flagellar hook-length control protein FliK [Desulfovibrio sp. OttesenSCG-928-G11]|nr:flagellar hook-length control protein FliK [Desulfovibrio sp. OttesenSCG-928-G11]
MSNSGKTGAVGGFSTSSPAMENRTPATQGEVPEQARQRFEEAMGKEESQKDNTGDREKNREADGPGQEKAGPFSAIFSRGKEAASPSTPKSGPAEPENPQPFQNKEQPLPPPGAKGQQPSGPRLFGQQQPETPLTTAQRNVGPPLLEAPPRAMAEPPAKPLGALGQEAEKAFAPKEKKKEGKEGALSGPGIFSGDALLASLQGMRPEAAPEAPAPAAIRESSELAASLAERILASGPDAARQEVRISLKDSVLPDTEIIIRREGEQLRVTLVTANASSHQTLVGAQHELRDSLSAMGESVSVEVQLKGGGDDADSSGRQSRGRDYMDEGQS